MMFSRTGEPPDGEPSGVSRRVTAPLAEGSWPTEFTLLDEKTKWKQHRHPMFGRRVGGSVVRTRRLTSHGSPVYVAPLARHLGRTARQAFRSHRSPNLSPRGPARSAL